MITDDQFKYMVSHNLIIMKHSIWNLNEKLNLIIERRTKLTQHSDIIPEDDIDYTNLNCIFPIEKQYNNSIILLNYQIGIYIYE